MPLEAIKYQRGRLEVLDQLQLPHRTHYDAAYTVQDGFDAIKSMRVRGAPAIAIVAILSLAVELQGKLDDARKITEPKKYIADRLNYLVTSRPTAVNLSDAAGKMKKLVDGASGDSNAIIQTYIDAAERMLDEDIATNKAIGDYGAEHILEVVGKRDTQGLSILTHCNTGSLATAGYGTALGVIRSLHAKQVLERAYCTETRPYSQGSRLTAYELVHDSIPGTLITDSMAAALMSRGSTTEGTVCNFGEPGWASNIAAVVVGADRVAANGDTANKIGTYALAQLAQAHRVKFFVAAPRTTIDLNTASGSDIEIEQRASSELTTISGPRVVDGKIQRDDPAVRISTAAEGIDFWNPAFDVTPHYLIDGIITEVGVAVKNKQGHFSLHDIIAQHATSANHAA